MTRTTIGSCLLACFALALTLHVARAQDKPGANASPDKTEATAPPGKGLLAAKCFQCHTDAMFRDQRQDRRAWQAALYRMVGRGALWTDDEINAMADYLAIDYGPQAPKVAAPR